MRILQIVHGYPPRYNAGSEVYTQTLSRSLAKDHQVMVFTRFENPYLPPYSEMVGTDADGSDSKPVSLRLINVPHFRDRYRHQSVDAAFARCLDEFTPDIVHIQHLNHLSTSLVKEAACRMIPIVFTLHDFWLMCPRGQFLQFFSEDGSDPLALCDCQEHRRCATHCYAPRYYSGSPDEEESGVRQYAEWIRSRMEHVREISAMVDVFIAPSEHLRQRFEKDFGLSHNRVEHLPYGFELKRLQGRRRLPETTRDFVFGYIGTHVLAKGIHQLLEAFPRVSGSVRLRIWGRPSAEFTPALNDIHNRLPTEVRARVTWEGEYTNHDIVQSVFNQVDAIVVPSIWLENSPLVIHEALQVRLPVITADAGGMAELVQHEVNGLLYEHRNPSALANQMSRLANDPQLAIRLGQRGYLRDSEGNVPSTDWHVAQIERIYGKVLRKRSQAGREVLA